MIKNKNIIKCPLVRLPLQLGVYGSFLKITDREAFNYSEKYNKRKREWKIAVKAAILENVTFNSHHSEIRKECTTKH